ncbi:MAG: transketolase [Deltaproteobacteria bacterium]|nr:transketolase [Deltaproteobacteria bacterium]
MTKQTADFAGSMDELCINTIRTLSMDGVQKANSGHPGAPMGLAAAGYALWTRALKHNPANPDWFNRDRFVLSGGHASMLLYSLLHLTGYDLSMDDIKNFRQWGSKTPGHPEFGHTPGVETTTGPLGQGFANAVGMAMAERHLAAVYNRPGYEIIDHYTYVMCGDGDMMEGLTAEAASLAGHLGLSRLICLYDSNNISIEGPTDIAFTENVEKRFLAYNWHVLTVADGSDPDAVEAAIRAARGEKEKPTLILLRTHIAHGSPNKQDTADAHGAPLGEEEIRLTKENLGWPDKTFYVPEAALTHMRQCVAAGETAESAWQAQLAAYEKNHPEDAARLHRALRRELPEGWDEGLDGLYDLEGPIATRAASGKALNAVTGKVAELIGGSADLAPSNKTYIDASHEFQKNSYDGRNIRFGVREHAMGSIVSGMALHKGLRPYGGTFFVFTDYMRPAIRLACLMKLPVIYVLTHDSIAVGEDGPTHQPVEHLTALRAIPGITVIRPADLTETVEAWRLALQMDTPVALVLSRQKLPVLHRGHHGRAADLDKGAYVLADADGQPDIVMIATGSEVHATLEAANLLEAQGVSARVVSMPSWELFEAAPREYRDLVLPPDVNARLAVEAGLSMGWERYVGPEGGFVAMKGYGASAPGGTNMEKFGFTANNIAKAALQVLKHD